MEDLRYLLKHGTTAEIAEAIQPYIDSGEVWEYPWLGKIAAGLIAVGWCREGES
jgi:hypothetical protein